MFCLKGGDAYVTNYHAMQIARDALKERGRTIQFSLFLTLNTAFDHLGVIAVMEGTEQLASTRDYDVSYNPATKTVTYIFYKTGVYTINYVDGK